MLNSNAAKKKFRVGVNKTKLSFMLLSFFPSVTGRKSEEIYYLLLVKKKTPFDASKYTLSVLQFFRFFRPSIL